MAPKTASSAAPVQAPPKSTNPKLPICRTAFKDLQRQQLSCPDRASPSDYRSLKIFPAHEARRSLKNLGALYGEHRPEEDPIQA